MDIPRTPPNKEILRGRKPSPRLQWAWCSLVRASAYCRMAWLQRERAGRRAGNGWARFLPCLDSVALRCRLVQRQGPTHGVISGQILGKVLVAGGGFEPPTFGL